MSTSPPLRITATLSHLISLLINSYLTTLIPPLLSLHTKLYTQLNDILWSLLHTSPPPRWFTANFVTYGRTCLLAPTIYLWRSSAPTSLASLLVLLVDFGDFLDGVLARYWNAALPPSPLPKPPLPVPTPVRIHRSKNWGAYIDAVLDKAYLVPLWLISLTLVPPTLSWPSSIFSHLILTSLILTESYSAFVRTRSFYTSTGVPPLPLVTLSSPPPTSSRSVTVSNASSIFSSSSIKADALGKCKQTLQMSGTSLLIWGCGGGPTWTAGIATLAMAAPMAMESVGRKTRRIRIGIAVEGGIEEGPE
ncbi:hypothetical protein TrRE_jg7851, partial [Triparma retinervis]